MIRFSALVALAALSTPAWAACETGSPPARITCLSTELANLAARLDATQSELAATQADLAATQADLASTQADVSVLDAAVAAVEATVVELAADLDDLADTVWSYLGGDEGSEEDDEEPRIPD